ncbi:MAG: carbon monoxide-induced hydrogenase, partial [Desulfovibrionaceae bacterium]|nr:carbon monoxide-induced hydrogenase [Desulfovibrionaceae bacterium]
GTGILPKEDALRLGVVGPVARGSGLALDVRKESPYAAYGKVDFDIVTRDGCDLYARTCVRLHEIPESIKILRQVVRDMPEGPFRTHMTRIFPSEAIARTEAPRGE